MNYLSVQLRKKAFQWIDAEADLIISHHPHIIHGKELYRDKNIYYSLGNFIFPEFYTKSDIKKTWKVENNRSVILLINFSDCIEIQEYGTIFKKNIINLEQRSITDLVKKSNLLDLNNYSLKEYFALWQKKCIFF